MAYVARDPGKYMNQKVGDGECVAYAKEAAAAPHTGSWRRGRKVEGDTNIAPGTVIATFDSSGRYGNRRDGTSHAAIYMGQGPDGIYVIDQWHNQKVHTRTIFKNRKDAKPINDAKQYYVVD